MSEERTFCYRLCDIDRNTCMYFYRITNALCQKCVCIFCLLDTTNLSTFQKTFFFCVFEENFQPCDSTSFYAAIFSNLTMMLNSVRIWWILSARQQLYVMILYDLSLCLSSFESLVLHFMLWKYSFNGS